MNDLSAFGGDGECDRQICDLRIRGKSEREVCELLGVTVADIHRALDRAAQASMTPQARVRDIRHSPYGGTAPTADICHTSTIVVLTIAMSLLRRIS
jgi:hypothetical protein